MEEQTQEQKFIDISPLSKWKRLLVFLGDYFLAFIISFIFFNIVVFPVAKVVVGSQKQNEEAQVLEQKALKMLKDDGYLFIPNDGASFVEDVNYTFKVFLSYYAFDDENVDTNNPQYGHKIENEVVRHYYENVIKSTNQYVIDFREVNEKNKMFDIGETVDSIALKADYKALLGNELLEQKDEEKYSEAMINFRDNVFARLFYIHVYNHITENDYVKDGHSFNNYMNESEIILKNLQWIPAVSSLISITLTWGIAFVLIPLVNKENRTITMMAMGVSKMHYKSLAQIDAKSVMIQSFYHFVAILSSTVFLPFAYFGLAYCFNLPLLFVLSLISFVLLLVSGAFIIFNQYNRSGTDIISDIVLVPTSQLDSLYMENINNGK